MKKQPTFMIKKWNNGWHHLIDREIYSDLTEKFPLKSFIGNIYIMVMYEYDINPILA